MEIELKAFLPINKELQTHIGNMTIKKFEIVKFEKTENFDIVDDFNNKIYPIKRFNLKYIS